MPTMLDFLCIANAVFYAAHSSDFCAWNRAQQVPADNNVLATYNFLNGEFDRDTSITNGGQSELFRGVPYYSMSATTCGPSPLYLYRHTDTVSYPPTNFWVIAAGLGTDPDTGYAYCIAASAAQDTPDGGCDGLWMIGSPKDGSTAAGHVLDPDFKIMPGGCPQITCNSITIWSAQPSSFTPDYNTDTTLRTGTFGYVSPNVYQQSGALNPTGSWYLFWNPKVWTWAIADSYDDMGRCEWYKSTSLFLNVAVVMGGPYASYIDYTKGFWFFHDVKTPELHRVVECTGTHATPAPTAQAPVIPTVAPADTDLSWLCDTGPGYVTPPTYQQYVDDNCFTDAPTPQP